MKKLIFVLLVILALSGCEMPIWQDVYIFNIEGNSDAHIVLDNYDYGFVPLPFNFNIVKYYYNTISSTGVNIKCWSINDMVLTIYKNGNLIYTSSGTFINY